MTADAISTLAALVGTRLKSARSLLATAESCTGGGVAQALTAVAGASDWFDCGFVVYSNAAKQRLLGVREETLAQYGAVSEATAREMARGALEHSAAGVALAVTGIAGPTGGTPEKPVGTVCFAWARGGAATPELRSETRRFAGDRDSVRRQSVMRALQGIVELLDGGAGEG